MCIALHQQLLSPAAATTADAPCCAGLLDRQAVFPQLRMGQQSGMALAPISREAAADVLSLVCLHHIAFAYLLYA